MNNLENAEAQQVGNLFASARPQAAKALEGIAGLSGNMSLGNQGQGIDAYSAASRNLFGLNAEQEAAAQRKSQAWSGLGGGIGTIAGGIFGGK
jgi:hypothetical protein